MKHAKGSTLGRFMAAHIDLSTPPKRAEAGKEAVSYVALFCLLILLYAVFAT